MSSASTHADYRRLYSNLACMAARDLNRTDEFTLSIGEMVEWLYGRREELRSTTWRRYRRALTFHCEDALKLNEIECNNLLTKLSLGSAPDLIAKRRLLPPKTSSHTLKRFGDGQWAELLLESSKSKSKYGPALHAYLEAGLASGLRPREWSIARLVARPKESQAVLVLSNCKFSDVRAHGPFRRLVYDCTTDSTSISAIGKWLAIVEIVLRGLKGERRRKKWATFCRAIGDRLREISDTTWPRRKRHPVLYSVRHLFAALSEAAGYSEIDIAALMGHAVDTTATDDYAHAPRGGKLMPPVALPKAHARDIKNVKSGRVFDPSIFVGERVSRPR